MSIRVLPPLMINQIAAGEVVERPASVVKELLENALDAGATRVRVEVEEGGLKSIRVSDDGTGIAPEELKLAVTPHATSKIAQPDDLARIGTLGFRGEALASIASVSRFVISSRQTRLDGTQPAEAHRLDASEGSVGEAQPCAGRPGTVIEVRELFCNTPARRKFLRSPRAESSAVREAFERVALVSPHVGMTLVRDGQVVHELPDNQPWPERARSIVGGEAGAAMLDFDFSSEEGRCRGLAGLPSQARANGAGILLCLNGRCIKDRSLQQAVREAYRGLVPDGRFPQAVVFIEIDPARVDVNVHPQKSEVRLADPRAIFRLVRAGLLSCLQEADLAAEIALPAPENALPPHAIDTPGRAPTSGQFVSAFKRMDQRQKGFAFDALRRELADESPDKVAAAAPLPMPPQVAAAPVTSARYLQFRDSFIVTEDEDGLLVIDQHALHERVMFEKLRTRILENGSLPSQPRLVPEVLDVGTDQLDALEAMQPLLTRLGFDAHQAGPRQVAVNAGPALLVARGIAVAPLLAELLQRCADGAL